MIIAMTMFANLDASENEIDVHDNEYTDDVDDVNDADVNIDDDDIDSNDNNANV